MSQVPLLWQEDVSFNHVSHYNDNKETLNSLFDKDAKHKVKLTLGSLVFPESCPSHQSSISLFVDISYKGSPYNQKGFLTNGNNFVSRSVVCTNENGKTRVIGNVVAARVGTRRDFAIVILYAQQVDVNDCTNTILDMEFAHFPILSPPKETVVYWNRPSGEVPGTLILNDLSGRSSQGRKFEGKMLCSFIATPYTSDCIGQTVLFVENGLLKPFGILWGHNWPRLLFTPMHVLFDREAFSSTLDYKWRQSFTTEPQNRLVPNDFPTDEAPTSGFSQILLKIILAGSHFPDEIHT